MKSHFHNWIIVLASLSLLMILNISIAQESLPVFRIGILDDERGPITSGARLAVREINESGGVRGAEGTMFRLELIIQSTETGDSLLNAIDAIDQARVIAVIGPETTEDVLSNLPLLQSLNVPILTPAIGDTVVASDSTGRIFRIRAAERWQGSALADYLVNDLNAQEVTTIQLDRNSTAARVGFSIALSEIPNPPTENTLLLDTNMQIADLIAQVINNGSQVAAVYGPPELASQLLTQLRDAGWVGQFAYHEALNSIFRNTTSLEELRGVISTTTWSLNVRNTLSDTFVDSYVRAYQEAPGSIEAASYDAINLLAQAISQPGDLRSNLGLVRDLPGVQGTLNPGGLAAGEISDTIAIVQMNAFGGADLISRYSGTDEIIGNEAPPVVEKPPTATPTPDGVIITIDSNVQNVRTGPGIEYDVLGQLRQGEQARVIGATIDFSWVVIDFRGQQGWLASYLLDIFGDRSTVPVIAPPPTPTAPPATATPTSSPSPDIVIVSASPSNITLGVSTNINVTIRNAGSTNAGPFAIAASFAPDNYFTSFNIGSLAAQTDVIVQLPVLLSSATGRYQVTIVADLNNEVNEGALGEANNDDFLLNYTVDRQLILINNTTLGSGASVDLEGNVTPIIDIQYTGAGLNSASTCTGSAYCIGVLSPNVTWDTATYDTVNGSNGINTTFISNAALTVGTTIGVLTGEGRRAIIRVDAINPGVSVTLTYRVYQ